MCSKFGVWRKLMDRQYEGRWQGERLIRLDIDENSDVLIGPTKYGWVR